MIREIVEEKGIGIAIAREEENGKENTEIEIERIRIEIEIGMIDQRGIENIQASINEPRTTNFQINNRDR